MNQLGLKPYHYVVLLLSVICSYKPSSPEMAMKDVIKEQAIGIMSVLALIIFIVFIVKIIKHIQQKRKPTAV